MRNSIALAIGFVLLAGGMASADTNGGADLNDACKSAMQRRDLDAVFGGCPRQRDGGPISDEQYAKLFVMRGMQFEERRDFAHAIKDLDRAVGLDPNLAGAWHQRANAYDSLGQHERAIPDYDTAIRLEPKNGLTFEDRCVAYLDLAQYDRALQDCESATALNPQYGNGPKGRILFYRGDFAKSADAFAAAVKNGSEDVYWPIWQYLATRRAGSDGKASLAAEADGMKLDHWPGPLIQFYLGKLSLSETEERAKDLSLQTQTEQECEAAFYLGEDALVSGRTDEARQRLQRAVEICPVYYIEGKSAKIELDRM